MRAVTLIIAIAVIMMICNIEAASNYVQIPSSGTIQGVSTSPGQNLFPYGGDWSQAIVDSYAMSGRTGWQKWVTVDNTVLYNGKATLKVGPDPNWQTDSSSGDEGCVWISAAGTSGGFRVKAGDCVLFLCWIKTGSASSGWIGIDWKDANWHILVNQYPYTTKTIVSPNSDWTLVTRHFGPCDSRAVHVMGLLNNQPQPTTTSVWFAAPVIEIGPNV
jgi:hypothetical protein